jgi:hypothetical protein
MPAILAAETMSMAPLAIDLFCGLGGWTEGLLAEGYYVVGFDNVQHVYGEHRYPAQLVIQDVLTLHGAQFRDAALIVASPPCQAYSYRAMPWKRAKALPPPDNSLFEACFRIQREASEAAGRYIPMVVENVRGAQPWVGHARWNYGSFYLWGDVPALMPVNRAIKNNGGSWFAVSHNNVPHSRGDGLKCGGDWFGPGVKSQMRCHSSKSLKRKMASAMIAKIPAPLSQHIARTYFPVDAVANPPASPTNK